MNIKSKSGRGLGADNLQRFLDWSESRKAAGDWPDYIRADKLNRSEIATECGFALSVLRQNPKVKLALTTLESRLAAEGILCRPSHEGDSREENSDDDTNLATENRIAEDKRKAERRVKAVEEINASLLAEISALREQLSRYTHLEAYLCATGRLLNL